MTRLPILRRPIRYKNGDPIAILKKSEIEQHSEFFSIVKMVSNYRLFGMLYWGVVGEFFEQMPKNSGAFVSINVESQRIHQQIERPGDIDILIIPYIGDEIIVDRIAAIEVKVIRARFVNQGKSPNKLGFSQANALIDNGFPYVALVHAITSDASPAEHFREFGLAEVEGGDRVKEISLIAADPLPGDLLERAISRLEANRTLECVGLGAVYTGDSTLSIDGVRMPGNYFPLTSRAEWTPDRVNEFMPSVANFLNSYPEEFLDIPRWS